VPEIEISLADSTIGTRLVTWKEARLAKSRLVSGEESCKENEQEACAGSLNDSRHARAACALDSSNALKKIAKAMRRTPASLRQMILSLGLGL
jgi:hypothetical protein